MIGPIGWSQDSARSFLLLSLSFPTLWREIYFHCSEFRMNGFSSEELSVKTSICDGDQQKLLIKHKEPAFETHVISF